MSAADYHWGELLGQGSFGDVWEAIDKETGEKVAVKVLDNRKMRSKKSRERLNNELKILTKVKHPNIITLISSFEEEDKVFLVTELCKHGELLNVVKNKKHFAEEEARGYFGQLVDGVKYLHSHTIIHRDLKLANLLLTEDRVLKIADFGLATQLDHPDSVKHTVCGTPNYLSPEIANREPYSLTTDLWSLGVVLYTMLCGTPPFQEDKIAQTIARVKTASFTCPNHFSPEAKDLVTGLLQKDGSKRIKISEIKQHPFFTGSQALQDCKQEIPSLTDRKGAHQPQSVASPSHSLKCITQQEIGSPSQTPFRPSNAGNFEDFNLEQDKQEEVPTREKMSQGGGKFGSQPKSSSVQQYPPVDENQDPTVEIDVRVGFRGSHRPPGHHRLEINAMENEAHLPSGNSHRNAPPVAMTPTFHNYSRQESDCPNQLIGSNQQPARNQEVNSALLEHKSKHSYNAPGNSNAIQGTPQAWDEQSHRDHIMLCRSHEFAGASLGPYDRNSGRYDRYHVESKQNVPSSNMMRRSFSQFETARGCQPFQQGCQGESDKGQALLPPNRRKQINSRGDQITDKTKVENDLTAHLASNMGLGNSAVCANSNQELNNPPQMLLEYAGNVAKVPDNPPINSDRDSHSSTTSSGVHGHSNHNSSQLALVERAICSEVGQGSRLGYRQNENDQIQFWFIGQHYYGTKAEEMRTSLEQLGAAGHVEALGAAGPCADHIPYKDLDMRICSPEGSYQQVPSTARLPSISRRTPKPFKLRAHVHILPDKSICVTAASSPCVSETRYLIGSDGVEVRIERRPLPGSRDLEPILRYNFPQLPMCVMIAYQVARDLVVELSDRVVQVEYAAYCGMGCMFESGSVILKMDEGHKQELGVEAVGLIMRGNTHDLYVKLSQQEDFDMFAVKVCTVEGGRQVYSIPENVAIEMSSSQRRAAELVFMLKANCEEICLEAITAESNGHLVQWPISGEDKLVVGQR